MNLETLAKDPEACLRQSPVAVYEGEKVLGYLIDPPYFEALMALAVAYEKQRTVEGRLQLSGEELHAIGRKGVRLLSEASEEDLRRFAQYQESSSSDTTDDGSP